MSESRVGVDFKSLLSGDYPESFLQGANRDKITISTESLTQLAKEMQEMINNRDKTIEIQRRAFDNIIRLVDADVDSTPFEVATAVRNMIDSYDDQLDSLFLESLGEFGGNFIDDVPFDQDLGQAVSDQIAADAFAKLYSVITGK